VPVSVEQIAQAARHRKGGRDFSAAAGWLVAG